MAFFWPRWSLAHLAPAFCMHLSSAIIRWLKAFRVFFFRRDVKSGTADTGISRFPPVGPFPVLDCCSGAVAFRAWCNKFHFSFGACMPGRLSPYSPLPGKNAFVTRKIFLFPFSLWSPAAIKNGERRPFHAYGKLYDLHWKTLFGKWKALLNTTPLPLRNYVVYEWPLILFAQL